MRPATETDSALLRLLTPVAKLYTAKQAIASASEHIEAFGGLGYLEDSGIPAMLRDAQVLSIWEGTTNVLSLDMLRAMAKEQGFEAFRAFAEKRLAVRKGGSADQWDTIQAKYQALCGFLAKLETDEAREAAARDVAFFIAELTIAFLWAEFLEKNDREEYANALDFHLTFRASVPALHSSSHLSGDTHTKEEKL